MCPGPVAVGWLRGVSVFPDLPEQDWGSTCLITSVKGAEGMQSPAHGELRVQISCLALEPHPGLALATLPGRPKKVQDYALLQRRKWRLGQASYTL